MKTKARKRLRQNRTRSEQRTLRRNFLRKTVSLLILLLCAVPMLGGRIQPLWTIPAAVCIAMHEDTYFSMLAAVIGGFAVDIACGHVLGANAIFLVCACTMINELFAQILRRGFFHYFTLSALTALLQAALRYLLTAAVYRLPGRELLWQKTLLPSLILTVAVSLPVYLLFLPCSRLLTKRVRSMDSAAIRRDF